MASPKALLSALNSLTVKLHCLLRLGIVRKRIEFFLSQPPLFLSLQVLQSSFLKQMSPQASKHLWIILKGQWPATGYRPWSSMWKAQSRRVGVRLLIESVMVFRFLSTNFTRTGVRYLIALLKPEQGLWKRKQLPQNTSKKNQDTKWSLSKLFVSNSNVVSLPFVFEYLKVFQYTILWVQGCLFCIFFVIPGFLNNYRNFAAV